MQRRIVHAFWLAIAALCGGVTADACGGAISDNVDLPGDASTPRDAATDVSTPRRDASAAPDTGTVDANDEGTRGDANVDASPTESGSDAASDAKSDAPSDAPGTCGSPTDPKNCGTCGHDCTHLMQVKPGGAACRDGVCVVNDDGCYPGFAHCGSEPDSGCDTDITTVNTCGACSNTCPNNARYCAWSGSGVATCVAACPNGLTQCGAECVDLANSAQHCGRCDNACAFPAAGAICVGGGCVQAGCIAGMADCDPVEPGCESYLGTFDNCGGCGMSCAALHTSATCTNQGCKYACDDGYGNCDMASPDCETPLATSPNCGGCGMVCPDAQLCDFNHSTNSCVDACPAASPDRCDTSCVDLKTDSDHCGTCGTACPSYQGCQGGLCSPRYVSTEFIACGDLDANNLMPAISVLSPDGSVFIGGTYLGSIDFDPTPATDIRSDAGGFVTKLNADGSYAWTRTMSGHLGSITDQIGGIAIDADGTIVVTGVGVFAIDETHSTGASNETYIAELHPDGSLAWIRTLTVTGVDGGFNTGTQAGPLVLGTDGSVYVAGQFNGTLDLDPGPGVVSHSTQLLATDSFVIKLDASGTFVWGGATTGSTYTFIGAMALAPSGEVWASGQFAGNVDFDPGPGVATSTERDAATTSGNGFVWKLGPSGQFVDALRFDRPVNQLVLDATGNAYIATEDTDVIMGPDPSIFVSRLEAGVPRWTKGFADINNVVLAPAPGGGVVLALESWRSPGPLTEGYVITSLDPDGNSIWTTPIPSRIYGGGTAGLASNATGFVIFGPCAHKGDFDPGPPLVEPPSLSSFISRYTF